MVTLADGTAAVQLARRAIERRVRDGVTSDAGVLARGETLPPLFDEQRGVFVTLTSVPGRELRGCIGFPIGVYPLRVAIPRAAVASAVDDPRFPPVEPVELETTAIEVSLLTSPERVSAVDPADRLRAVRVGVDGLILDLDGSAGLLLPQVAVEQEWTAERFLEGVSEKAGLPRSAWRRPSAELHRFQAERFEER